MGVIEQGKPVEGESQRAHPFQNTLLLVIAAVRTDISNGAVV